MNVNKKKIKWGIGIFIFLIIEFLVGLHIEPTMEGIGEPLPSSKEFFGINIPWSINYTTVFTTWGIMVFLVLISIFMTHSLKKIPSRKQSLIEKLILAIEQLCVSSLGSRKKGRIFFPFVGTLFIFVAIANWIPILPIPGLKAPTQDLNTTLGLALLCFLTAHVSGIKYMGFKDYILGFFEPMIVIKKIKVPNIFMAVLNIVGEIGKVISHSFRLFGNILGGAIIILIISNLLRYIFLPIFLHAFFDLFIGGLQAFIFGMLGLTYISLLAGK